MTTLEPEEAARRAAAAKIPHRRRNRPELPQRGSLAPLPGTSATCGASRPRRCRGSPAGDRSGDVRRTCGPHPRRQACPEIITRSANRPGARVLLTDFDCAVTAAVVGRPVEASL
jgi:hypothetical protein